MDLNKFGKRAYNCALKRGKISELKSPKEIHEQTVKGLSEETAEVVSASEVMQSDHLAFCSQTVEELADVAIVTFTELHRRGVDIEKVLHEKMKYNEQRAN